MVSNRQLFLRYLAGTSDSPMMLEIVSASGIYMYDNSGRKYTDLISGVSVSYLGHNNKEIVSAVKDQADRNLHLMVYGEFIQAPQVKYAELLCSHLPGNLDSVYFVNSGAEAIEGAMKVAKRFTGRSEIIAFKNAYHGSTQGALSIMGGEYFKMNFRPLLPGVTFLDFNNTEDLDKITVKTACVVVDPLQSEAGIRVPENNFLSRLREQCNKTGSLLIFDEIQTGFGRLGSLFACNEFNVTPDIMVLAKSLGGGMPLGAFISSTDVMSVLKNHPALGHITTFGGHPVSCAAGLAAFNILLREELTLKVREKEDAFRKYLKHPAILEIRGKGLQLAIELGSKDLMHTVHENAMKNGIITDWFLFCDTSLRISPALIITFEEIKEASEIIIHSIEESLKS